MAAESVSSRFNRDWEQVVDDRDDRAHAEAAEARNQREYVDGATGVSELEDVGFEPTSADMEQELSAADRQV